MKPIFKTVGVVGAGADAPGPRIVPLHFGHRKRLPAASSGKRTRPWHDGH